jgi:hypothetical protein
VHDDDDAAEVARKLAELDQEKAATDESVVEMGQRLARLRATLIIGGFSPQEAFVICRDLHAALVSAVSPTILVAPDDDGD